MPRSKHLAAVLLVASLAGCTNKVPETVWIAPNESTALSGSPIFEAGPVAVRSQEYSIPALPERTITLGDSSARLKRVQDLVDRNRQLALAQIEARLLDAYLRDIDILAREKRRQLETDRRDGLSAAYEQFIVLFESYARRRGPALAELSMLADFPDSDPRSLRTAPEGARIEQQRLDRARSLRERIAALDTAYRSETGGIILSADKEHASNLREFRESIELMRLEADERATAEARKQLQGRYILRSVLESAQDVTMPEQSGKLQKVAADSSPSLAVATSTAKRFQVRTHDIEVFGRVKGYRISESRVGARDATKEFEEWRKQRSLGL